MVDLDSTNRLIKKETLGEKKRNLYFMSFIVCGVVRKRADDEGQAKCSN